MAHNTYGLSVSTVLAAIRENRRIGQFWDDRGFKGIAATHAENVRDLRVLLMNIRFPENTYPHNSYGADFSPVITIVPDTEETENVNNGPENTPDSIDAMDVVPTDQTISEVIGDSDRDALAHALADTVEDATGEPVTTDELVSA